MIKNIYSVASGSNTDIEASNMQFYTNISELFEALENLCDDNRRLKTQGTKKPLRSTNALEACLVEDTVYLELVEKTKVISWYNINKIDLEVTFG